MADYRLPEIARLAHELSLSPARHRLRQLAGAERLVALLEPGREYPLSFVYFHVTGFRRRAGGEPMLDGDGLIADLVMLIDALSADHPAPAADWPEPIHSAGDLAARFHVSARTITRWRSRGLVARWFVGDDGRSQIAVTAGALARFVARHAQLIRRAAQFQVMSVAEKSRVLLRARALAAESPRSTHALAKQLAAETGRATETIRLLLLRHEIDSGVGAVDALEVPVDVDAAIVAAARSGATARELAVRFGRSESDVAPLVARGRQEALVETTIEYVYTALYDHPQAEQLIFAGPGSSEAEVVLRERATTAPPASLPAYMQAMYRVPLLTAAGEKQLFQQMNYARHRAEQARRSADPSAPLEARAAEIESWLERSSQVKSQIVQANLRLVISIAKRHVRGGALLSLFELVSDGNLALMRAVDKFDVSRGFKFSTYASWAIMRHFARSLPVELARERRFRTGQEQSMAAAGAAPVELHEANDQEKLRETLRRGLDQLDARERAIIEHHFGLADGRRGRPLEEIGRELGISKERARQLKERALVRLRALIGIDVLPE
ncbi:MAG: sigma-70 family RNA polymerase sigma factor [Phycisphaerae bacterium]